MKHLLSILLCLALLASSFTCAEATDNTVSKLCTIDDIVVTVDGEEFALPMVGKFAIAYNGDAMLYDIGLEYNSQTLFPIQMKLTGDDLSLLIGDSSTAYVFDAALVDGVISNYSDMVEILSNIPLTGKTIVCDAAAVQNVVEEALCAKSEETTYNDSAAVASTGTLDGAATYALLDKLFAAFSPEAADFYFEYMSWYSAFLQKISNAAIYGAESDESEETEDITSFAQLLPKMDIEIVSCDYNIIAAESGAGKAGFNVTIHIPESELEYVVTLSLVRDEVGITNFSGGYSYPGDSESYTLTYTGNASATAFDLSLNVTDSEDISALLTYAVRDDGSNNLSSNFEFSFAEDRESFDMTMSQTFDPNGNSDAQCKAVCSFNNDSDGSAHEADFSFDLSIETAEYEDRISAAQEKRLTTEEDLTNAASMLSLRLMSLMGDVETLSSDETLTALSDALTQLFYTDAYSTDTTTYTTDDLSFEIPEFTGLPEGYSLVEENYYAYSDGAGSACLIYSSESKANSDEDDEFYYYSNYISVSINNYGEAENYYILDADGTLTKLEGINITEGTYYTSANFERDDVSYNIIFYINDFSMDDVVNFISGIVWDE